MSYLLALRKKEDQEKLGDFQHSGAVDFSFFQFASDSVKRNGCKLYALLENLLGEEALQISSIDRVSSGFNAHSSMEQPISRSSKLGALCHAKGQGFTPTTIIDVGVQKGTPELYAVFPDSMHVLIEPVAEQEPIMQRICEVLPNATYIVAAAAARTGTTNLRVSHNAMYSNMTSADDTGDSASTVRTVPTVALDDLVEKRNFAGPILLKIDVDGQELDVIQGATRILKDKVEYVIVESTLFGQINEVITAMLRNDFAIYDILEPLYRPLDGALWQVDLVFVRKDGKFREKFAYASEEEMRKIKAG